jgi:serine/threonine protein kinase
MEFIEGASLRMVIDRLTSLHDPGQTLDSVLRMTPLGEGEAPVVRFDQETVTYIPGPGAVGQPVEPGSLTPEAKKLVATPDHLRRCCEIVRDAGLALAHAHERGVVHRDIKPENLLLDRQLKVHVVDSGIARFLEDLTVTNTGQLVGTPLYMSPEEVTGRLEVDHRTDIYSLGLVLYELLTLRRPLQSPTREGILRQIVTKPLPPASWRNQAIPRDLESVVHQAAARDPGERYQSASDLVTDLENFLDGKMVTAVPYRYKFDDREIVAARPPEMVFGGFWLHFSSLYALLIGLEGIWDDAVRFGLPRIA